MSRRIRIVGREPERQHLAALMGIARDEGLAVFAELVGEAGIGKTTLLDSIGDAAPAGALVLRGRAAAFERDLPYGVFIDAFDAHLASLDRAGVRRLGPRLVAELAAVFPALEAFVDDPVNVVESERFRLHRAVRALLELLASRRLLVLALDDLHWADPASCDLLASLLRRPPEAQLLLALAYRPGRIPTTLSAELDAAVRGGSLRRIELGPLSREQSEELLNGQALGGRARDALYRQSRGNPFYLEQLARSAVETGRTSVAWGLAARGADEALAGEVPPTVATALAGEVAAVSGAAQAVIQAGAVAGEPFEPDLLAEIAGVSEADALVALDELQDRDLVRPTEVPRQFRFRHPLVRHGVYGSLKGGWRVAAHARAASALAERGAPAAVRAPHVEYSARAGDESAIALLAEAGRASVGLAPVSAARWLRAAVRLAPSAGPAAGLRRRLLPELAAALASIGLIGESREALIEALELASDEDPEARFELVAACAGHEITLGRYADARSRLVAALDAAGDGISREAVLVDLELAGYGTYANDHELTLNHAGRAINGARTLGDRTLLAHGTTVLSLGLYVAGRIADALDAHAEASQLVAGLDDASVSSRLDIFWVLGWVGWFLGRHAESERHFARGMTVSRSSGRAHLLTEMTVGRSIALTWLGRLPEAISLGEDAIEAAALTNNFNTQMWSSIAGCLALTASGEIDGAVKAAEQSLQCARRIDVSAITAGAAWTSAAALIEAGDSQGAVELMLEMLGGPDLPGYFTAMRPLCYELLTRGALAAGGVDPAREWVRRASASASELGSAYASAYGDLAAAQLSWAENDARGSAEFALRAAEVFEAAGARIYTVRARLLAGRALAGAGDRERAGVQLRAAEVNSASCGAKRLRSEAVRELRAIGRRVNRAGTRGRASADGIGAVSGREREVAELITARKTNREIAAELYLSEKTIESHVSSLFVKLGVSSRADVARVVERDRAATA